LCPLARGKAKRLLVPMAGRASVAYSLKYGSGDLIAQHLTGSGSGDVDRARASYFFAFGGYYGVINYSVFWLLSRCPFPTTPWAKAIFSAFMDGGVHVPLSFYPQFYFFKELMSSPDWRQKPLSEHFLAGLAKYKTNMFEDVVASLGVFLPLGILNFRYVPLVWRSPVLASTSVIFPIIVSTQRGASVTDGS